MNEPKNVLYDDFIPMFTGSNFNPEAWVNLFADAGAKYFVLVTVRNFITID
jgi:alpha-L-fucosidase